MNTKLRLPACAFSLLALVACAPGRPKLIASAEGFQTPESVRYDADLDVLFVANIVYATSYVATRATLGSIPPGTLAFARLAIAWTALAPFARPRLCSASTRSRCFASASR